MRKAVGLGIQDFEKTITVNNFYIDKTKFISEWWKSEDDVTLITRPRRFGKTFTLSTVEKFFSARQANAKELFQGLEITNDPEMMKECGQWPVLFVSFAGIKSANFDSAMIKFNFIFSRLLSELEYLKDGLTGTDLDFFNSVSFEMKSETASECLHYFSKWLSEYYGKKVIILLDEYDTPMM